MYIVQLVQLELVYLEQGATPVAFPTVKRFSIPSRRRSVRLSRDSTSSVTRTYWRSWDKPPSLRSYRLT